MTRLTPSPSTSPASVLRSAALWRAVSVALLLAATATLYLVCLDADGWANSFYAAAVQAGSHSWKAMLFGSSDAGNAITVDKPPAALWVMDASARIFGFNSWSLLVPQALMGVAAVGLLYASVRRVAGHGAGLLAGVALASTPVATLMFRFDNPDALLVLLLVAAAYCGQRSLPAHSSRWWLPLAGIAVGFAFLTKMMQAYLVLPGFALVYLLAADTPLRRRLWRALAAVFALVVSSGWYLLLVELWPAAARPYIGGSQHNSILELTLGYNGFGRITGNEAGGLGNMNFDTGPGRLFGDSMGAQISWLLPAAAALVLVGLWLRRRAPRTDPERAALLLWGSWLTVTGAVFSFANGILHPYYTVALAPAIAACVGIGTAMVWRHRADLRARVLLALLVAGTTTYAWVLLDRDPDWNPWLRTVLVIGGAVAAVLLLGLTRLPRTAAVLAATVALLAGIAGPAAYSVSTAATAHSGAIPSAGPAGSGMFGPHGRPGGGPPPRTHRPGAAGTLHHPVGGPAMGGMFGAQTPSATVVTLLRDDAGEYRWAAATVGSDNAAGYQLATGAPVMAVGGFNGTDPAPTLAQFQADVAAHRIHWFIGGAAQSMPGSGTSGSRDAADIATWVAATFPARDIDGVTVYDLTART